MSVSDNMSYDDVITIGDVKANGPKINVGRLRDLATAGSSLRLFEVSDEDMAKSLQSMTQQKVAKKTQLLAQEHVHAVTSCVTMRLTAVITTDNHF